MIARKTNFNELVRQNEPDDLERHLVYSFLLRNRLDIGSSHLLAKYFEDFQPRQDLYLDISALNIGTIKDLENHLELVIPAIDRKLNGAFFTPDYVVDFIVREVDPKEADANLDPSCGCGAFLVGLAEYYRTKFAKSVLEIVRENIYGSDILEYNVRRAKLILATYALLHGESLKESDINVFHQDSLKAKWDLRFDNIVGNPPYVKFQDLDNESRAFLEKHWTTVEGGTFNLYFAFFELGYKLLKPEGKLGFITPNNYFTSLAGESLRRYFQHTQCVTRIVDFSHKKVFDAQTYTAITFLSKSVNEQIIYDRIATDASPQTFLMNANGSPNYLRDLNPSKWRLLKSDERENIAAIETAGMPIGRMFDISVGIATLKDDVFFIDGSASVDGYFTKTNDCGEFRIEATVTRPVYKISDFKSQAQLDKNTRRIICPYRISKGAASPIPEKDFREAYPECYAYLLSEKQALAGRDKGKTIIDPFYSWGRTQGLTKSGKKLVTPTFSRLPRFMLVEDEDAFFTNGYGIFCKQSESASLFDDGPILGMLENMDIVQKILNSAVMDYYVTRTSVAIEGGYPCYQKNFIEKFTIPNFSAAEIQALRALDDADAIDAFLQEKYQIQISPRTRATSLEQIAAS